MIKLQNTDVGIDDKHCVTYLVAKFPVVTLLSIDHPCQTHPPLRDDLVTICFGLPSDRNTPVAHDTLIKHSTVLADPDTQSR